MTTTTRVTVMALTMAVAVLTFGFWTAVQTWEDGSTGGPLHRLSADFSNFDGTETFTDLPPPGQLVYRKRVAVPSDHNVLYVNITATGDQHDGAAMLVNCRVDGNDCNPGNGDFPGFVTLLKMTAPAVSTNCNDGGGGGGDCHDNNFNYTWCIPINPDPWSGPISHDVELRLATSEAGDTVFYEAAHYYIDSNYIEGNACEQAEPVPPPTNGEDGILPDLLGGVAPKTQNQAPVK
jgi:hypothetical protein